MIHRVASIVVLPVVALAAACVNNQNTPGDACAAAQYQSIVGAPLAAVSLPADLGARIIEPGMAVTMDYNAERLNIDVDADGRVTRVYCG